MKGIILAGGTGSRLYPLTKVTNKHLLPIGKYPMIYHNIFKLKQAGIKEILIVTGREHMGDVVNLLGSGEELGLSFIYRVQDKPGGIAQALGLAHGFIKNESVVVLLGDNIFSEPMSQYVDSFRQAGEQGARILITQVDDPSRFGVPELDGNRILSIEEKPKQPKSNYAVTGIYMYDRSVFDIITTLKPSKRGELEITDVNNAYIRRGELTFEVLQGWWTDAGTHESYFKANQLAMNITYDTEAT